MKIAAAQLRPVPGDIAANLAAHRRLIERAASSGAEAIVFPELSLTGYEPELARTLALDLDDPRLDELARLSEVTGLTIVVGVPLRTASLPRISLAWFHASGRRAEYSKRYLHADELPYFTAGDGGDGRIAELPRVALAICYELSVPEHAEAALRGGADVYVASVAKSADGVAQASARLAAIAREHSVVAVMVNCVGPAAGFEAAGRSSAWDREGRLIAGLDESGEGVLVVDV